MGPIAKAAQEKFTDKSIQFVLFDFTTDETIVKAEADAKRLGVAEIFAKNAPKTGFALLVDTSTNTVLTKLSARQDVVAWSAAIDKGFGG